jgi:hypothetical protein
MTSETTKTTTATTGNGNAADEGRGMLDEAAVRASEAIDRASAQMPQVMDTASNALNETARRLESSPDDVLTTGAALSTGVAIGLYIGGAPRILVSLAMLPAIAMGWTLLSRSSKTGASALKR